MVTTNDLLFQLNPSDNQKGGIEYFTNVQADINKDHSKKAAGLNDSIEVSNVKINFTTDANATRTNEVIHLFDIEGSLLNVTKEPVHSNTTHVIKTNVSNTNRTKNGKLLVNLDEYFQTVLVYKCIKCSYMCEDRSDIIKHISDKHLCTIQKVWFY